MPLQNLNYLQNGVESNTAGVNAETRLQSNTVKSDDIVTFFALLSAVFESVFDNF